MSQGDLDPKVGWPSLDHTITELIGAHCAAAIVVKHLLETSDGAMNVRKGKSRGPDRETGLCHNVKIRGPPTKMVVLCFPFKTTKKGTLKGHSTSPTQLAPTARQVAKRDLISSVPAISTLPSGAKALHRLRIAADAELHWARHELRSDLVWSKFLSPSLVLGHVGPNMAMGQNPNRAPSEHPNPTTKTD